MTEGTTVDATLSTTLEGTIMGANLEGQSGGNFEWKFLGTSWSNFWNESGDDLDYVFEDNFGDKCL